MAGAMSSHTPYGYGYDNPVSFNDPSGAYPEAYKRQMSHPYTAWKSGVVNNGGGAYGGGSFHKTYGMSAGEFINDALKNSTNGGHWENGGAYWYESSDEAFEAGIDYVNSTNSWQYTAYHSEIETRRQYRNYQRTGHFVNPIHFKYDIRWKVDQYGDKVSFRFISESQTQGGPTSDDIEYVLGNSSSYVDEWKETMTYTEYGGVKSTVFVYTVAVQFDKSYKIIETAGRSSINFYDVYGNVTFHRDGPMWISPRLEEVIDASERYKSGDFGEGVWEKYWKFIMTPDPESGIFNSPFGK